MSILASLARSYDRMLSDGKVPSYGYARTTVGCCIVLTDEGRLATAPISLLENVNGKLLGRRLDLPTPLTQRTSGISPNFLWDKTAYSLGLTVDNTKSCVAEHKSFIEFHLDILSKTADKGLLALLKFIENLSCATPLVGYEFNGFLDFNVVFALESEYRERFIHDRPESKYIWGDKIKSSRASMSICLITGNEGRIARTHPPIKRVYGAQTSGAFLVSFNANAFESYGNKDGDNAPVSEAAAFAYTTVLNRFLERDSGHRLQVGDASTVFWADAPDAATAQDASDIFAALFDTIDENVEAKTIHALVEKIRDGQPLSALRPDLSKGVRFTVLGLAPNAARLSIRFFVEDDFGQIAENYLKFAQAMQIDPPPRVAYPPMWQMLQETAAQRKPKNIPPNLGGEWLRSVLTGAPYPLTLLTTILMRVRADHDVNGIRAAIIKIILIRNFSLEVSVALDQNEDNPAYVLGRLFAVLERIQFLALGKVNATIRDRFFGAASSAPQSVFPLLLRLNVHHQSKAEKETTTQRRTQSAADDLKKIIGRLGTDFPKSLSIQSQGRFMLGYYHQSAYRKSEETTAQGDTAKEAIQNTEETSA